MANIMERAIDILSEPIWASAYDCSEVYNEEDLGEFDHHSGVSKVVIVLEDCVVKKAFSGYANDWDDEAEAYLEEPEYKEYDIDFCEVEYDVYLQAVKEGVGKFFAETSLTDGMGVYKQEKCDIDLEDFYYNVAYGINETGTLAEQAERDIYDYNVDPTFVKEAEMLQNGDLLAICNGLGLTSFGRRTRHSLTTAYFLAYYEINELKCLQRFMDVYDINDIHACNAGFFNGVPKIYDFCGYESETPSKIKKELKS